MTMPSGTWTVVAVVVAIVLTKLLFRQPRNLPPGPRSLPIIGHLHLLGKHPHWELARLAETHGPLMSIKLGPKLTMVASSPAMAEQILRTQGPNFTDRPETSFRDKIAPGDIALENDSPLRLHLKKVVHMQLSTSKQIQLAAAVRREEIEELLRVLPQDGTTLVSVRQYVELLITNIMSRMILKKRFVSLGADEQDNAKEFEELRKFRQILLDITKLAQDLNPGDFLPIFKHIDIFGVEKALDELKTRMDEFMNPIINEHVVQRASGELYEKDVADVLLDAMEDTSLQFEIGLVNIRSTLWDMFTASMNTTTDAIEWAIAECIRSPSIMRKAQAEIDEVVGTGRRVADTDIPNLKYLQAIVKENFRLHQPLPMMLPHVSNRACEVDGFFIPAKTWVFINVAGIGRGKKTWEDPDSFKPERFAEGTACAGMTYDGNHFGILPFGSGRRHCPGIALASTLVHITVATFIQNFDWSLPDGVPVTELDMTEDTGISHNLARPLSAIPRTRISVNVAQSNGT